MRYRTNRRTGDRISEIGIGSAYLAEAGTDEAVRLLRIAKEGGINYFDLAAGDGKAFPIYGEAFSDIRKDVIYQIHFGADYSKGTYGWSLDPDTVKRSVEKQLSELRTDYIDYGFIHCIDDIADWEKYKKNGIYDQILRLKETGTVRHIGLSSHEPSVINRILDDADVDMVMFSVNPAFDYGLGTYANGSTDERYAVYERCEREGIGISVMKPFFGGKLLDREESPFKRELTEFQCIRYCLDRPGVLTVLPGARNVKEVAILLDYFTQPDEKTDYSVIGSFAPPEAYGKCLYCRHCMPCPQGIDIGLVNKYYDLAKAGDAMAKGHYDKLRKKASDCTRCGKCDSRCPFKVEQSKRMQEIRAYMETV
ncbi:MAG: aldo/keto reductase [Clostridia bacterium]|nr:aldo/keto reductase [Clostridia bacterium]